MEFSEGLFFTIVAVVITVGIWAAITNKDSRNKECPPKTVTPENGDITDYGGNGNGD